MSKGWLAQNPNATKAERLTALAERIVGEEYLYRYLEEYGFPEDWDISDESPDMQELFNSITIRCRNCDVWCWSEDTVDSICEECVRDREP